MLHLAWRGVRANTGRYIATIVAIVTGVAFFAATGFLSDGVIASLEGDVDEELGAIDVAIVPEASSEDPGEDAFAGDLRLDGAAYDDLLAAEGVEAGAGVLTGPVAFLAADGSTFADGATGRLWIVDDDLNPVEVVEGSAPEAAGEIAVDQGTAEDEDLTVGGPVTVLTHAGQFDATISGITAFGGSDSIDERGTVSVPEASAFEWLGDGEEQYDDVYLRGSGAEEALTAAVAPVVPAGFSAQSGSDFRADQRQDIGQFGRFLKQALQGFAGLALLVGAFVIYNTFSVIVAQRMRELAVLAAVGATARQIKRSLRFEGLVIGILGSAIGVVAGVLLTLLLDAILSLLGVALPGGLKITPFTVIASLVLGTLVTFWSVTVPARRASRAEPIEALRDAAVEAAHVSRRRIIFTVLLLAFGIGNLVFGGSALAVGVGALALFVGVVLAGPLIAILGARVLRPLMSLLGLEGRLAIDNTARNPQRTATTANALLIGVFLVTLVTVAGTSLKDFVVAEIRSIESADFLLTTTDGVIDEPFLDGVREIEGVETVAAYRSEPVAIDGTSSRLSSGDLDGLGRVAALRLVEGSLGDLRDGTIALPEESDPDDSVTVGDTVSVTRPGGVGVDLEVVAVLENNIDTSTLGSITDAATLDRIVGRTEPNGAFVGVADAADPDATEDAIDAVAARRPDVSVTPGNVLGNLIGSVFEFLINAVNGLLLMSVVVALIGIVNTLSLSILERRRELGLLRVIGMLDARVQRMVRLESVLIAGLGTVSGLLLGTFVGWALVSAIDRLSDAQISFSFPVTQLAVVLVLGIALGAAASWIPSRRSTRLEVLDAIAAT